MLLLLSRREKQGAGRDEQVAGLDEIDAGWAKRSCWESSYDREKEREKREGDMNDK